MYIVQILLPVFDNDGQPFATGTLGKIREELATRFGGVTAFSRTPAEGVWSDRGRKVRDEVVLVEVLVEQLDRIWWHDFRKRLEERLRQKSIMIRALAADRL
jgi:hypothetical protein